MAVGQVKGNTIFSLHQYDKLLHTYTHARTLPLPFTSINVEWRFLRAHLPPFTTHLEAQFRKGGVPYNAVMAISENVRKVIEAELDAVQHRIKVLDMNIDTGEREQKRLRDERFELADKAMELDRFLHPEDVMRRTLDVLDQEVVDDATLLPSEIREKVHAEMGVRANFAESPPTSRFAHMIQHGFTVDQIKIMSLTGMNYAHNDAHEAEAHDHVHAPHVDQPERQPFAPFSYYDDPQSVDHLGMWHGMDREVMAAASMALRAVWHDSAHMLANLAHEHRVEEHADEEPVEQKGQVYIKLMTEMSPGEKREHLVEHHEYAPLDIHGSSESKLLNLHSRLHADDEQWDHRHSPEVNEAPEPSGEKATHLAFEDMTSVRQIAHLRNLHAAENVSRKSQSQRINLHNRFDHSDLSHDHEEATEIEIDDDDD